MQDDLRNALVRAFGASLVEPIKEEGNDATTDDPRDIPIQIGDDDEEQHQQERKRRAAERRTPVRDTATLNANRYKAVP